MTTIAFKIFCFFVVAATTVGSASASIPEEDFLSQLMAPDAEKRFEAAEKLATAGVKTVAGINRLNSIASTGDADSYVVQRHSSRWFAIVLLGRLRVQQAVPWLISNVQLHDSAYRSAKTTQEMHTFDYYFPCVQSLIEMRESAIEPIFTALLETKDQTSRQLLAGTLRRMNMPESVRNCAAKFDGPQKAKPIAQALQEVEQIPLTVLPPVRDKVGGALVDPAEMRPAKEN